MDKQNINQASCEEATRYCGYFSQWEEEKNKTRLLWALKIAFYIRHKTRLLLSYFAFLIILVFRGRLMSSVPELRSFKDLLKIWKGQQ